VNNSIKVDPLVFFDINVCSHEHYEMPCIILTLYVRCMNYIVMYLPDLCNRIVNIANAILTIMPDVLERTSIESVT